MIATVTYLVVTESERNKGYGSLFIQHIQDYCNSLGKSVLEVEDGTALRFLKKHGFTRPNRESCIVKNGHLLGDHYCERLSAFFAKKKRNLFWRKNVETYDVSVPDSFQEAPIRIIELPTGENVHHIAWYRKSDGAAVAKVQLRI